MIGTWVTCIVMFFVLPLQLENRQLTLFGFLMLLMFIGSFAVGGILAGRYNRAKQPAGQVTVFRWRNADRILSIAAIIALVAFFLDSQGRDLLDLGGSYSLRDQAAQALLGGTESSSSLMFQIGFLFYPAGYVLIARQIAFKTRPNLLVVVLLGAGPIIAASLIMGGRFPLLYALVIGILAYRMRRQIARTRAVRARPAPVPKAPAGASPAGVSPMRAPRRSLRHTDRKAISPRMIAAGVIGTIVVLIYSARVFVARANVVGGIESHLAIASNSWGVNFNGRFSGPIFDIFGVGGAYILFVFSWYAVQGFVMSNVIFTDYHGPMLFGTYGIDLAGAIMRRLNGDYVAASFYELVRINTYGFLPSAFGTLFVDLKYFGLLASAGWGWMATKVYMRAKEGCDPRWMLASPFMVAGVFFSLLNTPLGFANGFSTHLWLIFAVLAVRPQRVVATGPLTLAANGAR